MSLFLLEGMTMTSKLTIALQDNMLELVQTLGEPATVVPAAVRRYVVDRSLQRLEVAEERVRIYAQRYGMAYETFQRRVALDDLFLEQLNKKQPLWEADAIEWAQWTGEVDLWRERLTQPAGPGGGVAGAARAGRTRQVRRLWP